MFLTIAFVVFAVQSLTILLLVLPIPIKLRRSITELAMSLAKNKYLRFVLMALVLFIFGLFVENLLTVLRYDGFKQDINDINFTTINGKHEVLMKLFRAQRNMYLTFIVNFNWIVLFGIHGFITTICKFESNKIVSDALKQAIASTLPHESSISHESCPENDNKNNTKKKNS